MSLLELFLLVNFSPYYELFPLRYCDLKLGILYLGFVPIPDMELLNSWDFLSDKSEVRVSFIIHNKPPPTTGKFMLLRFLEST